MVIKFKLREIDCIDFYAPGWGNRRALVTLTLVCKHKTIVEDRGRSLVEGGKARCYECAGMPPSGPGVMLQSFGVYTSADMAKRSKSGVKS